MNVITTSLPGVLIIEPKVFQDPRGFFLESFHAQRYEQAGVPTRFVQDNWSRSSKGILRGLHYQEPHAQGKLVFVTHGSVFDVAVDIRKGSPTFGKWFGTELTETNHKQMFVPAGFAHGFCVLSDVADFHYKCTELYAPECDGSILWNDPEIGITWPVKEPILSKKDLLAKPLRETSRLPVYSP